MTVDALRRRLCLAAGLALFGGRPAAGAQDGALRLGVMPVYGIRLLLQRYEPMRAYLARLLGRPVRIETAPDFPLYLQRLLTGEFDIAVTAAHFARIAQRDAGWVPLVQFEPHHDTLIIVRADRQPAAINELAGREVAVIDRVAITVMGALHYLEKQGLRPDLDFRVTEHRTHASVVHSLLSGESFMAVTTSHGLRQVPDDLRKKVVVYRDILDIPAFTVLAGPSLPAEWIPLLRGGMFTFAQEREGIDFLAQVGYSGLRVADEATMRRADPYLKETRRVLLKP